MVGAEPFSQQVCVVILDDDMNEDQVRRLLGDAFPLRLAHWRNSEYLATIGNLQPRVIVIAAAMEDLATDSSALVACLFERFSPTVASLAMVNGVAGEPSLAIVNLGSRARARISSLSDLSP